MVDPFHAQARRERLLQLGGLGLLLALLSCALVALWMRTDGSGGREVNAFIVRFGTYPDPLGTGDLPIITVRFQDGSIRQVRASRSALHGCVRGNSITLVQRGNDLKVGLRGFRATR